jgi:hypothetical protein
LPTIASATFCPDAGVTGLSVHSRESTQLERVSTRAVMGEIIIADKV